jgi:hypothetical protein
MAGLEHEEKAGTEHEVIVNICCISTDPLSLLVMHDGDWAANKG